MSKGVQLVIPMAGEGQRFQQAGIKTPKPLIDVGGIRMFELVVSNLFSPSLSGIVLVVRREFGLEKYGREIEKKLGIPVNVISVDQTTGGPAKSVLLAEEFLQGDVPVVVANSDQYVYFDPTSFYADLQSDDTSGLILTMEDDSPKWSYVELANSDEVIRVVEKEVVSRYATVGIYGFKKASEMFDAIKRMEEAKDTVNSEYYLGPCYNYLSRLNGPVRALNLGAVGNAMHGLGVPEDLEAFLAKSRNRSEIQNAAAMMSSL